MKGGEGLTAVNADGVFFLHGNMTHRRSDRQTQTDIDRHRQTWTDTDRHTQTGTITNRDTIRMLAIVRRRPTIMKGKTDSRTVNETTERIRPNPYGRFG